jgi:hypothetical protein
VLVVGLAAAVLSTRTLMPAALFLVVLAADALGMFGNQGGDDLPYLQVMAGLRLTVRDGLLLGTLPLAVLRLVRRREAPLFTWPLLGVLAAVGVAFLLGVLADGGARVALNLLRPLFGYALYVVLVAAVDSRHKLDWLLATIFATALVGVAIQAVEAARGSPLPFLALPLDAAQRQAGVTVDGRQVPYIANRATWHLFLSLFLGLGCVLEWRAVRLHAPLAVMCLLGFLIGLARSWYVFIGIGALAMLVACASWRRRVTFLGALFAALGVIWVVTNFVSGFTERSYGGSITDVWLARSQTLLSASNDPSYRVRVAELSSQWTAFLGSPLFGYGLSRDGQRFSLGLGNLDTGAINTLIMFGIIGSTAFLVLIGWAVWTNVAALSRLRPSRERGYVLGVLGVWAGLLVGYAFNWDFFTHPNGPWLVVLALTVGDRVQRLALRRG